MNAQETESASHVERSKRGSVIRLVIVMFPMALSVSFILGLILFENWG